MNCSTPGLPVHHQLPEFTQTHIHRVGDAIQPSHPLPSPSPPAPNPSQHQSLFQRVNSSHEVAKVLEFQLIRRKQFYSAKQTLNYWKTAQSPLNQRENKSKLQGFSGGSVVKNPPANARDVGLILGLERWSN